MKTFARIFDWFIIVSTPLTLFIAWGTSDVGALRFCTFVLFVDVFLSAVGNRLFKEEVKP